MTNKEKLHEFETIGFSSNSMDYVKAWSSLIEFAQQLLKENREIKEHPEKESERYFGQHCPGCFDIRCEGFPWSDVKKK